ncbi:phage scaffolding protein [Paenibacillus solani]|uniref:phage scaffolding protein n=1 Tax=Paenibacillus solani TaxID=1705565 RepID=UPI003D29B508
MDLKELLGEELYNQVIAKAGDKHKIALVSDGAWIPKDKFNEVNEAKKKLEGDLSERDKQLADLKKDAGDNEALKEQISKLQESNKEAADKYAADVRELQLNTALKLALGSDVHDADYAISQLDKTKIEIGEDGSIKAGLEDQVKSLRESKAFLFAEKQENTGPTFKGAKPAEGGRGSGEGDPVAAEISSIFSQR